MPNLLIVDDHTFIRRGVRSILSADPKWEICGEAQNGEEAIRFVADRKPEVVVMDVSMPVVNGFEATRIIRRSHPATKILLLTLHDSVQFLKSAFQAGANGYLLKSDAEQELIKALRVVMEGHRFVSGQFAPDVVDQLLQRRRA